MKKLYILIFSVGIQFGILPLMAMERTSQTSMKELALRTYNWIDDTNQKKRPISAITNKKSNTKKTKRARINLPAQETQKIRILAAKNNVETEEEETQLILNNNDEESPGTFKARDYLDDSAFSIVNPLHNLRYRSENRKIEKTINSQFKCLIVDCLKFFRCPAYHLYHLMEDHQIYLCTDINCGGVPIKNSSNFFYQCPSCNYKNQDVNIFKKHLLSSSSHQSVTKKSAYICKEEPYSNSFPFEKKLCGKSFPYECQLLYHLRDNHQKRPCRIDGCKTILNSDDEYPTHVVLAHRKKLGHEDQIIRYTCPTCDYSTIYEYITLHNHMARSHSK